MNLPPPNNRTWIVAILLALAVLTYGFFELLVANQEISEERQAELAQEAIRAALGNFAEFEQQFVYQSQDITNQLTDHIRTDASPEQIYNRIMGQYDFWGISVFRDKELWIWEGFGELEYDSTAVPTDSTTFVDIGQSNNVTYLKYAHQFQISGADTTHHYMVVIKKKIQQNNILAIGDNAELEASELFQSVSDYPVHFHFFQEASENAQFKTTLSTQSIDSAGVIYTLAEDDQSYQQYQKNLNFLYRAVFYGVIILLFTLFLVEISKTFSTWKSLFLKLLAITIAWLFFANLEYGVGWLGFIRALGQGQMPEIRPLLKYGLHALFILLITSTAFSPFLKNKITFKDKDQNLNYLISALFGFLSFSLLLFYLSETYQLFTETSITVLDLDVFPTWQTIIFYVFSGIFAISATVLLTLLGWFLLKSSTLSPTISIATMFGGFAADILLMLQLSALPIGQYWLFTTSSIFFIVILILIYVIQRNPALFSYTSRMRMLMLFSSITVAITYISIYKGYSEHLNSQMQEAARLFVDEEESQAEIIATELLTNLEQNLSGLSESDFIERPAIVENIFIQQTQQLISTEWEAFSISTQLVDNSGQIIGEYTSDINSPAWTRAFNILSLVIPFEEERIRIDNLRPIVRERPLDEESGNYSSFRRAWIPLYDFESPTERIGWILCSVYRERPQFEKPIRAVLAAQGNEDWNASINVTEFVDGENARNTVAGIPLELPGYSRLPQTLIDSVHEDSTLFRTHEIAGQKIREYFIATSPNRIIRAATVHPGLENHLFSIIRYFFFLLITGLIVLAAFSHREDLNILGHNQRFRDRLIDRFILASLLCLMALTTATYYAIKDQNQKNIQDQLLGKVDNLAETLSSQPPVDPNEFPTQLTQLTSALDADASIYSGKTLKTSTTNQIYQQHLLPDVLHWPVYQALIQEGNYQTTHMITLGDQPLLKGYQAFEDDDGNIAGIVAIPTFLEAPKFNEQLLSTTSYLLGLYAIIFGFFIVGAALISSRLTAPIEDLREGLQKISDGNLETTLPVRSQDEIGSLTNAYNVMVYRLQDLREDLARAEREAAWKEMAQQVAHEIKNPLTPMKLNLQHLERQLKSTEEDLAKARPKVKKITANMIEQIESLSQIASDFSKFAKPIDQEFEPVEMNELLLSVSALYETEKKLVMRKDLADSEIWILGVKDELRRVFINLVKNAYEAMPKSQGNITLASRVDTEKQKVQISVIDDGEGIAEEHQDRIFVPNFSTKSSGTGLGLAISKKIIEAHDGTITLVSVPGEGTTFTIELPLKEQE
ncbi:sensor histidine kinase [Gracilimonas mengyeensis]|uniref:histidine kinase n=1 Tax=Gracilimonas mengyeensis TaxID=1302730 RepID=A0A521FIW5_9BACT|nr:ATP-binding protein [Gracilimonas mengyeensis]SMO96095.1 His Kinase A (phospho-acceptor) domain-containing protein [Gracilimonas mengyeensis]